MVPLFGLSSDVIIDISLLISVGPVYYETPENPDTDSILVYFNYVCQGASIILKATYSFNPPGPLDDVEDYIKQRILSVSEERKQLIEYWAKYKQWKEKQSITFTIFKN